MKTIAELRDDLSHKVRSAQDIKNRADAEKRDLTDKETLDAKNLLADGEQLKIDIKRLEDQAKLIADIDAQASILTAPGQRVTPQAKADNTGDVPAGEVRVVPAHQRIGGLKGFTARAFGDNAEQAAFAAHKSAMWLGATLYNNRNCIRWMQNNVNHNFRADHSEGTNSEGGYAVPEEMTAAIIDLREQYGVFRAYCRARPMASDTLMVPRKRARWSASWTPEATALTESSTAFDQVRLVVNKLGGYALISTELAEDAIVSIVDELTKDMGIGLAYAEDDAGFNGDGTPTYGGIVGLKNSFTAGSSAGAVDATSGHDTFLEIDVPDVMRMIGKLPDYARANAKIFCSRQCAASVFGSLKASAGGNTVQTMEGNVWGDFLGIPIIISQLIQSSTGTINDTPICYYGDLGLSSSMGERRGVTVKRSDEIKFLEDQITLKVTERVDIVNHDCGDTSSAGAIVALMGNT